MRERFVCKGLGILAEHGMKRRMNSGDKHFVLELGKHRIHPQLFFADLLLVKCSKAPTKLERACNLQLLLSSQNPNVFEGDVNARLQE